MANFLEDIKAAANEFDYNAATPAQRDAYFSDVVLTVELTLTIGKASRFAKPRTFVVGLTQSDVNGVARSFAEYPNNAAKLHLYRAPQTRVIVVFPTGRKNHETSPTCWIAPDGVAWVNDSCVVNNRHARVLGWADELAAKGVEHNSGWTGVAK